MATPDQIKDVATDFTELADLSGGLGFVSKGGAGFNFDTGRIQNLEQGSSAVKTADYTVESKVNKVLVDTTAGDVTITIPTGRSAGQPLEVYKVSSDVNIVTIAGAVGVTVPAYNKIYDYSLSLKLLHAGSENYIFSEEPWIPGDEVGYNWNVDPTTLGVRVLPYEGQVLEVASYPGLTALCYIGDSANATADAWYRCDNPDGSGRNTTGAYIVAPDGRGRVGRQQDPTATVDPDGASRTMGDKQADAFQGFDRWSFAGRSGTSAIGIYGAVSPGDTPGSASLLLGVASGAPTTQFKSSPPKDDGTNGPPRTDSETRAANRLIGKGFKY